MGKILNKFRTLLRSALVSLGIVIAPYAAHAGYSMADRGPANTPINGTVRSLETGDPIAGIWVTATGETLRSGGHRTVTDTDGNFRFLVPESEWYYLYFDDFDEELNGGFFGENIKRFYCSDIQNDLNIFLEEQNLITIHGYVRSKENNTGIPEINLRFDRGSRIGYQAVTNSDGSFSIRVPERENYSIYIWDSMNRNFIEKIKDIELNDTRNSLEITLEEENIITIRGFVYSKTTMQAIENARANFSFPRIREPTSELIANRHVRGLTNNEGYFEVLVPERDNYNLFVQDLSNVYSYQSLQITKPADDEIIRIFLERH